MCWMCYAHRCHGVKYSQEAGRATLWFQQIYCPVCHQVEWCWRGSEIGSQSRREYLHKRPAPPTDLEGSLWKRMVPDGRTHSPAERKVCRRSRAKHTRWHYEVVLWKGKQKIFNFGTLGCGCYVNHKLFKILSTCIPKSAFEKSFLLTHLFSTLKVANPTVFKFIFAKRIYWIENIYTIVSMCNFGKFSFKNHLRILLEKGSIRCKEAVSNWGKGQSLSYVNR